MAFVAQELPTFSLKRFLLQNLPNSNNTRPWRVKNSPVVHRLRNPVFGLRQCRINNSSKCSNCYGPRAFGGPAVFCNKSCLLHYVYDFFSLRSHYSAKFAISSKRRFSTERRLRPEILLRFFLYSYATKGLRLWPAVFFSWFAAESSRIFSLLAVQFSVFLSGFYQPFRRFSR